MAVKLVHVLFLSVLLIIQGVHSDSVLVSNPAQENGELTACAGQRISLTCSHSNVITTTTQWRISSPVNCSISIAHQPPPVGATCGQFTFEDITATTVLNSTAEATADVSMTDGVVECIAGNMFSNFSVGNISLCIVGPLSPPGNVSCQNISDGLNITWGAVVDDSCSESEVEYNVTVTRGSEVVYKMIYDINQGGIKDVLQPNVSYNISVSAARTVTGSCGGEPATILCQTSSDIEPPSQTLTTSALPSRTATTPTQPSMTTSNAPSRAQPPSPDFVIYVVPPIIVVVVIIIIIVITVIIVCICCRPGRNRGDQKVPLSAHTGEEEHKTESAPVYAMVDKSKKGVVDDTDLPTYQDPSTIQHEQAMTGDLYAVADKPKKGSKKEKSEAPLGDMYSVPDKSKKSQLTYAEIEMSGGSGRPVNAGPQTDYATVVN